MQGHSETQAHIPSIPPRSCSPERSEGSNDATPWDTDTKYRKGTQNKHINHRTLFYDENTNNLLAASSAKDVCTALNASKNNIVDYVEKINRSTERDPSKHTAHNYGTDVTERFFTQYSPQENYNLKAASRERTNNYESSDINRYTGEPKLQPHMSSKYPTEQVLFSNSTLYPQMREEHREVCRKIHAEVTGQQKQNSQLSHQYSRTGHSQTFSLPPDVRHILQKYGIPIKPQGRLGISPNGPDNKPKYYPSYANRNTTQTHSCLADMYQITQSCMSLTRPQDTVANVPHLYDHQISQYCHQCEYVKRGNSQTHSQNIDLCRQPESSMAPIIPHDENENVSVNYAAQSLSHSNQTMTAGNSETHSLQRELRQRCMESVSTHDAIGKVPFNYDAQKPKDSNQYRAARNNETRGLTTELCLTSRRSVEIAKPPVVNKYVFNNTLIPKHSHECWSTLKRKSHSTPGDCYHISVALTMRCLECHNYSPLIKQNSLSSQQQIETAHKQENSLLHSLRRYDHPMQTKTTQDVQLISEYRGKQKPTTEETQTHHFEKRNSTYNNWVLSEFKNNIEEKKIYERQIVASSDEPNIKDTEDSLHQYKKPIPSRSTISDADETLKNTPQRNTETIESTRKQASGQSYLLPGVPRDKATLDDLARYGDLYRTHKGTVAHHPIVTPLLTYISPDNDESVVNKSNNGAQPQQNKTVSGKTVGSNPKSSKKQTRTTQQVASSRKQNNLKKGSKDTNSDTSPIVSKGKTQTLNEGTSPGSGNEIHKPLITDSQDLAANPNGSARSKDINENKEHAPLNPDEITFPDDPREFFNITEWEGKRFRARILLWLIDLTSILPHLRKRAADIELCAPVKMEEQMKAFLTQETEQSNREKELYREGTRRQIQAVSDEVKECQKKVKSEMDAASDEFKAIREEMMREMEDMRQERKELAKRMVQNFVLTDDVNSHIRPIKDLRDKGEDFDACNNGAVEEDNGHSSMSEGKTSGGKMSEGIKSRSEYKLNMKSKVETETCSTPSASSDTLAEHIVEPCNPLSKNILKDIFEILNCPVKSVQGNLLHREVQNYSIHKGLYQEESTDAKFINIPPTSRTRPNNKSERPSWQPHTDISEEVHSSGDKSYTKSMSKKNSWLNHLPADLASLLAAGDSEIVSTSMETRETASSAPNKKYRMHAKSSPDLKSEVSHVHFNARIEKHVQEYHTHSPSSSRKFESGEPTGDVKVKTSSVPNDRKITSQRMGYKCQDSINRPKSQGSTKRRISESAQYIEAIEELTNPGKPAKRVAWY